MNNNILYKTIIKELNTKDYKKSLELILKTKGLSQELLVEFSLYCAKKSLKHINKNKNADLYRKTVKCLELVGNWLIDKNSVSNKDLNKAAHAAVNAAAYAAEAAAYAAAANAAYAAADAAAYAAHAAAYAAAYAAYAAYAAGYAAHAAAYNVSYKENFYKLIELIFKYYKIDKPLFKMLYL